LEDIADNDGGKTKEAGIVDGKRVRLKTSKAKAMDGKGVQSRRTQSVKTPKGRKAAASK
jgi:hypothetical protein